MEEMYALFGAMQGVTGQEGRQLDYLSRNLERLYEPDVAKKLGIQTTAVMPDLTVIRRDIISIMAELNQKIKEGVLDINEVAEVMGATGKGQRQKLVSLLQAWDEISVSMNNALTTGGNFAEILNTKMDSTQVKVDAVKQAWDSLMATMGGTESAREFLDFVARSLNSWVYNITVAGEAWDKLISKMAEGSPILAAFLHLLMQRQRLGISFGAPVADTTAGFGGGTTGTTFGARATGGAWAGAGQPQELGRWPAMYNVPEGVSFGQIKASMDQWTEAFRALRALGSDFELWVQQHQESALIYDENTKTIRQITGFLPALQRAISENTQMLKEQQLNVGLRTVDMNLDQSGGALRQWIQYYTEYLNRLGMPQEARPQLIVGLDDTFLRIWASNEALMLALRALTEATEDQTDALTGMWNVPEGATMWVPIQSLPMPPTTLPPPQQDWMGLPGAVEQMSVGLMSVSNFEGLAPPDVKTQETTGSLEAAQQLTASIQGAISRLDQVGKRSLSALIGPGEPALEGYPLERAVGMAQDRSVSEIKTSSVDLQSPTVDAVTPSLDAAVASATIMAGAGTNVNTPMVNLLAGGLTGITPVDMTTTEMLLSGMAQTLILIYNALSNLRSYPISGTPTRPGEVTIESGVINNDNLERFIDNRQYQVFRLQSRMKSPW